MHWHYYSYESDYYSLVTSSLNFDAPQSSRFCRRFAERTGGVGIRDGERTCQSRQLLS